MQTFSLSKLTINTWRQRNVIPERYKNGKREEIISADEKQQLKNLQTCFNAGKLNITALSKVIGPGFRPVTIYDFLGGKGVLYRHELVAIKKAINTLKNETEDVLRALERKSELSEAKVIKVKNLLLRKEIYWHVVFNRNQIVWHKFEGWGRGARSFPEEARDQLKSCLIEPTLLYKRIIDELFILTKAFVVLLYLLLELKMFLRYFWQNRSDCSRLRLYNHTFGVHG